MSVCGAGRPGAVSYGFTFFSSFFFLLCSDAPICIAANYEENESRGWYCALLTATGIQYILAITGIVLLYTYYDCALSKFFITFNMVMCLIVSVLSVLPQIQERISRSGLLQSSVVTLYVVYLTWSALSNNSDQECVPHGALPMPADSKVSCVQPQTLEFESSSVAPVQKLILRAPLVRARTPCRSHSIRRASSV